MLMGLEKPLIKGETLTVILTFEKAGPVQVAVPIASIAAMAPEN
jgi:copper(I)-binding protein